MDPIGDLIRNIVAKYHKWLLKDECITVPKNNSMYTEMCLSSYGTDNLKDAAIIRLDNQCKKAVKDMIEAREKISKLDVQIYDLNEELESYKNMSIFQFIMKKMRAS